MKTGHTRTFGRRAGRASGLSLVLAGGGLEERGRDRLAVQRGRLGEPAASTG